MAVSAGITISASVVNSLNSQPTFGGAYTAAAQNIEDLLGNGGEFYSHRPSGSTIISVTNVKSGFGMTLFILEKYVNGEWIGAPSGTITGDGPTWFIVEMSSVSKSLNSTGPGRYRLTNGFSMLTAQGTWGVYCGQTDIQVGQKVICWDDFQSSLNQVNSGNSITAALANAGRIGGTN